MEHGNSALIYWAFVSDLLQVCDDFFDLRTSVLLPSLSVVDWLFSFAVFWYSRGIIIDQAVFLLLLLWLWKFLLLLLGQGAPH